MVKTKDELINDIQAILGENSSDDAIALLENVSDTLDSVNNTDIETLQRQLQEANDKIRETDENWRKKYIERFKAPIDTNGSSEDNNVNNNSDNKDSEEKELTFENLFKEVEK
jgi:hypothetical protein